MINFHQDDESYQIVDFSSKYRIFIKTGNFRDIKNFSIIDYWDKVSTDILEVFSVSGVGQPIRG